MATWHTPGMDLVARAEALARRAHAGQYDKAGLPYWSHPARVAERVGDDPSAQAAAWLHDVVEDCDVTLEDLLAQGFPARVVAAVGLLTRRPGQPAADYYAGIRTDPLALRVKLADLADNSDPDRLALLDRQSRERLEAKYTHARRELAANEDAAT